jgi:hypothetical protein
MPGWICAGPSADLQLPTPALSCRSDGPFWREALALGAKAVSVFPRIRFAGIDVAITPTGPAMIELNVFPNRISAVRWDLPHKDFFEPALYITSEVKRD